MNLSALTIGEIAAIEKYSGHSIADFDDESAFDTKTMCAFGVVIAKRLGLPADISDIEQLSIDELTALLEAPMPNQVGAKKSENAEAIAAYLESISPLDAETQGE